MSGVRLPCTVPPLPASRHVHTQDGLVACGGGGPDDDYDYDYDAATRTSCVTLTSGGWQESHQLQYYGRRGHSSWSSPAGLLLMGGGYTSTEILSATDSSTTSSFLTYYTL